MAALATLAGSNVDRAAVWIEIRGAERRQFAIPAAGRERCLRQAPEIGIAGIEQPLGLGNRQIAHTRGVGFLEGLDTAPSVIGRNSALTPRAVKRGLQHCQGAICAGTPSPDRLMVALHRLAEIRPLGVPLAAQPSGRARKIAEPFLYLRGGQPVAL